EVRVGLDAHLVDLALVGSEELHAGDDVVVDDHVRALVDGAEPVSDEVQRGAHHPHVVDAVRHPARRRGAADLLLELGLRGLPVGALVAPAGAGARLALEEEVRDLRVVLPDLVPRSRDRLLRRRLPVQARAVEEVLVLDGRVVLLDPAVRAHGDLAHHAERRGALDVSLELRTALQDAGHDAASLVRLAEHQHERLALVDEQAHVGVALRVLARMRVGLGVVEQEGREDLLLVGVRRAEQILHDLGRVGAGLRLAGVAVRLDQLADLDVPALRDVVLVQHLRDVRGARQDLPAVLHDHLLDDEVALGVERADLEDRHGGSAGRSGLAVDLDVAVLRDERVDAAQEVGDAAAAVRVLREDLALLAVLVEVDLADALARVDDLPARQRAVDVQVADRVHDLAGAVEVDRGDRLLVLVRQDDQALAAVARGALEAGRAVRVGEAQADVLAAVAVEALELRARRALAVGVGLPRLELR